MNVFIVYAHPEPTSFNAALLRNAQDALRDSGHGVLVSDLYAMRFDPVSDRRNFTSAADAGRLDLQAEEAHASRTGGFVAEIETEMAKLDWCDVIVLQFPLWWLGMPAILKGWIDRVLALGVAYGGGRYFATGMMRGKRAMCVVSVGGSPRAYDGSRHYASIDTVLYPIHRGILEFTGFEVLPPFVTYAPQRMDERERKRTLDTLRGRMQGIGERARPSSAPLGVG